MTEEQKAELSLLNVGHEFPPASYRLDPSLAAEYLDVTEDDAEVYHRDNIMPPMAVAARALAALIDGVSLPSGSIHVSQEFRFMGIARAGDTMTSHARLAGKRERGNLHLMTIDLRVLNQKGKDVLTGKMSFVLPRQQTEAS